MMVLQQFKWMSQAIDWCVVDTETTGFGRDAEIVSVAIVGRDGNVLLDTKIRPKRIIPDAAIAIHGITNEMVKDSPTLYEAIQETGALANLPRNIVAYNEAFDRAMFQRSMDAWGKPRLWWEMHSSWVCAMKAYADFRHITKIKLSEAVIREGLQAEEAHDALGDALMTWRLARRIAGMD
jgi:DNA polymerase III epsilon subunit-like protein